MNKTTANCILISTIVLKINDTPGDGKIFFCTSVVDDYVIR